MLYLYLYLIFAIYVALFYVFLYHEYYMTKDVKNAPKLERMKVYGLLFISIFICAPYGAYEIIKIKLNGGFKK